MVKLKKPKFETDRFKGKTDKLHERNFNKYGFDFHPEVSLISGTFVLLLIGLTLYNPEYANVMLRGLKDKITGNFNWFFILSANFFLVFPIYLMCSKLGEIRLGGPEAKPEFSNFSWYSMLMGAGMGIGLLFFGVAEPIFHANSVLPMTGGSSPTEALAITFLHWGFHGWGIYALIALALAFFHITEGFLSH
jgi:choline-glycine betaine transporter